MIKPISVLDNISKANKIKQRDNSQKSYIAQLPKDKADSFVSSSQVAFEAKKVKPKDIEEVYARLNADLVKINSSLKTYIDNELPKNKVLRGGLAVLTLWLSEKYGQVKGKQSQQNSINYTLEQARRVQADYMYEMGQDIQKNNNKTAIITADMKAVTDYYIKVDEIERKKLIPLIITPLLNQTMVPNCIMISAGDEATSNQLIDWTKNNAWANVVMIDEKHDIVDYLEQAEEHYQQTGERTLLHVQGLDNLINSKTSDERMIGAMKSIMDDCAKDYHTTILFSSKNPDELDEIAMADHRVSQIRSDLVQPKLLKVALAEQRLAHSGLYVHAETYRTPELAHEALMQKVSDYIEAAYTVLGLDEKGWTVPENLSKDKALEISLKLYDELASQFAEKLRTPNINYTYDVKPETISLNQNGKIEQFEGYRHVIKFDKETIADMTYRTDSIPESVDLEKNLEFSFFSTKKQIENLPIHVALYNALFKGTKEPVEPSVYRYSSESMHKFLPDSRMFMAERQIWGFDWYPEKDYDRQFLLKMDEEFFNKYKDSYKTGIETIDKLYMNPETSPFSLNGHRKCFNQSTDWHIPSYTKYEPKESVFKYDLLHSYGDNGIFLTEPKSTFALNGPAVACLGNFYDLSDSKDMREAINNLWNCVTEKYPNEILKRNMYKAKLKPVEVNPKDLEKFKKETPLISSSEKVLSPDEISRLEVISRLRDKKRNIESPVDALRDVLVLTGMDKKINLSNSPSEEEMASVLRAVRDDILELTKKELMSLPRLEREKYKVSENLLDGEGYAQRYDNYKRYFVEYDRGDLLAEDSCNNRYFGLPALLLIADEHLANNKDGNLPLSTYDNHHGTEYNYHNTGALFALAKDLPSYEVIKTASDALEGIARRPIWYSEKAGIKKKW